MIKGVSLDNLGPFITSGGRDTGAGPPEPLDSPLLPQSAVGRLSAAEPLQLAHCRRTAGALPALAPYGPQSQSTAPRAPHMRASRMNRQGGAASAEESCERTTRCPTSRGARREGGRAAGGGSGDARPSSGSRQSHPCPRPRAQVLGSACDWTVGWLELVLRPRTLRPRRQHPLHVAGHSRRTWASRAATSTCRRRRRRRRVLCDGGGKEGWCGRPLFNRNPVYRMCVCVME